MTFQRTLAITPTSIHTIAVILTILWIITGCLGSGHCTTIPKEASSMMLNEQGWWVYLPIGIQHAGWFSSLLALLSYITSLYLIAELNISHILLRINSRIFTIILALLISACSFLHSFTPGTIIMLCSIMSFFSLFNSYQAERSPGHNYMTFMYLSIAALFYPKLLWLAPFYWLSMYILRAINLKNVLASILGLITPIWIVGSLAFYYDHTHVLQGILKQFYTFNWGGYTLLSSSQWIMIIVSLVMFLIGTADFYARIYLDKNKTRNQYYSIILLGFALFTLLMIQPCGVQFILPATLIITSIMFGHYIVNGESFVSNIIVLSVLVIITIMYFLNTWIL